MLSNRFGYGASDSSDSDSIRLRSFQIYQTRIISSDSIRLDQFLSDLTSFHQTQSDLTSFHQIPSDLTAFHQIPSDLTSFHQSRPGSIKLDTQFNQLWPNSIRFDQLQSFPSHPTSFNETPPCCQQRQIIYQIHLINLNKKIIIIIIKPINK